MLHPSRLVSAQLTKQLRMANTKVVLKDVATRYFRPGFVYRSKMGFPLPLSAFLLSASFRPLMEDRLLPGLRSRGVVDMAPVDRWWQQLKAGSAANVEALWICAAFELWAQCFLDRAVASTSS
jgi:asparagine synthetase B (glutamine-hydrolysing)